MTEQPPETAGTQGALVDRLLAMASDPVERDALERELARLRALRAAVAAIADNLDPLRSIDRELAAAIARWCREQDAPADRAMGNRLAGVAAAGGEE